MTDRDSDYQCKVCGRWWCVRILASDCCSPERRKRLEQQ